MNKKTTGIFFTILSAVIYGFAPTLTKILFENGMNTATFMFFRSLFSIPLLMVEMRVEKLNIHCQPKMLKNVIKIAFFGTMMTMALLSSSYNYISVGSATTLHFTYPVIVAILCRIFYKEKLSREKISVLAIAAAGVVCFFDRNTNQNQIGIFMALGSGLTYAYYMMEADKKGIKDLNPLVFNFYVSLVICVSYLVLHLITGTIDFTIDGRMMIILVVSAILYFGLANRFFLLGIKYLGASQAAIFSLFEPITSILFGGWILKENVQFRQILGCFVIALAILLLLYFDNRSIQKGMNSNEKS